MVLFKNIYIQNSLVLFDYPLENTFSCYILKLHLSTEQEICHNANNESTTCEHHNDISLNITFKFKSAWETSIVGEKSNMCTTIVLIDTAFCRIQCQFNTVLIKYTPDKCGVLKVNLLSLIILYTLTVQLSHNRHKAVFPPKQILQQFIF